jgi:hypothetical protein
LSDIDAAAYLLIGSSALATYTGRSLWLAYSSRQWPKAVGHIVEARADVGVVIPNPEHPSYAAVWNATFVYRYNVGGAQRTGSRLRFTPFSFREGRRAAAKYKPGHGVRVAVHPTDPNLTVLEPGATGLGIAAFSTSLALALLGAAWFIISIWK